MGNAFLWFMLYACYYPGRKAQMIRRCSSQLYSSNLSFQGCQCFPNAHSSFTSSPTYLGSAVQALGTKQFSLLVQQLSGKQKTRVSVLIAEGLTQTCRKTHTSLYRDHKALLSFKQAKLESSTGLNLTYLFLQCWQFSSQTKGGHVQVLRYKVKYWKVLIADAYS